METNSTNSKNVREYRRLRAVELYDEGMKAVEIARILNVTRGAVSQWLKKYREHGKEALLYKKIPRKKCRISMEQTQMLVNYLKTGAEAFGFTGNLWTRARIASLIFLKFGIHYHITQVGRILHKLGWTWQKPARRASQRDEQAITQWCTVRWPEIKKSQ